MNVWEYTLPDDTDSLDEYARRIQSEYEEYANYRLTELIRSVFGKGAVFGDLVEDVLSGGGKFAQDAAPINTYPFGEPTGMIYPDMLAVYKGETKAAGWNELLKRAHSYAVAQPDHGPKERNILILTDTWSPKMLDKLERKLLRVYFKGNLTIHVVLYTYCGFTPVPLITDHFWGGKAPKKLDLDRQLMRMDGETFTLTCHPSTLNRFAMPKRYEIEIYIGYKAIIKKSHGNTEETLYADQSAVRRFVAAIMNLPQEPVREERERRMDAPYEDFGISAAIPRYITDTYGDKTRGKVLCAFWELIRSAGDRKPWKGNPWEEYN